MDVKRVAVGLLAVCGALHLAAPAWAAGRESLREEVRLEHAPSGKDAFTLFYDITLKAPGMVRAALAVDRVSPDKNIPKRLVGVALLQKRTNTIIRRDVSGKGGSKLEYSVDALELEKTGGEYRIYVTNFSTKHTVLGSLVVLYPGEPGSEAAAPAEPRRPDLAIERIWRDRDGSVVVAVKNVGTGPLPASVWNDRKPESASLLLEIDGKSWGGGTLWAIDPQHHLGRPGGRVVYKSNYKVTRPVQVKAIVDRTGQVHEADEGNNEMAVELRP